MEKPEAVAGVRVSLFVTCFNDTLFPQTGRAVVRLLERLGCEVDFPLEQTCCGQMHMNSGYAREGAALARRLARVFDGAEHVVRPSASCAGMLRQHVDSPVHRAVRVPRRRASASRTSAPSFRTASRSTPPATRCASSAWATGRCAYCGR